MTRQQMLVLGGMLVAVLGFVLQAYTTGNAPVIADPAEAVHPRSFPEKPDPINATTAAAFAASYEETWLHNDLLDRQDNVARIDTYCSGTPVNTTDTGYRISVECGYTWETRRTGRINISDGGPYTVYYLITPTRTRRMVPIPQR